MKRLRVYAGVTPNDVNRAVTGYPKDNHSRPWEKLPQPMLNLLNLHSMYAVWEDNVARTLCGWRIKKVSGHLGEEGVFVSQYATLEMWVALVTVLDKT